MKGEVVSIYPNLVTEWPSIPDFPLPPDVAGLPTMIAEPWVKLEDFRPGHATEGSIFDADGNLLLCERERPWSQIVKVTPEGEKSVVWRHENSCMVGLAVHKNGDIYAADLEAGRIFIISPEGECKREILQPHFFHHIHPNDLDFDKDGNLYISDFVGDFGDDSGAIWRADADGDYTHFHKILGNLYRPNGVGLSPAGDVLWTSESGKNTVIQIKLDPQRFKKSFWACTSVVYQGASYEKYDSLRVDSAGNVYQAVQFGGRCLILNKNGIPVANVVVEGRELGDCNHTPNLALKYGTSEGYMLGCGPRGSYVFKFNALAPAQKMFCNE